MLSHSYDFRNLFLHSLITARKNYDRTDKESLHVLKSRVLGNNCWNDVSFMENMNKISLFKQHIGLYHETIKRVIENGNTITFFIDMKECSKEITIDILRTVYYKGGTTGIINIQNNLNNIISGGLYNPDCLKLYNLIIYSSPFVFGSLYEQNLLTQAILFQSPYELIATYLQTFITTMPFEDPSIYLRMQIKLECALPNMSPVYDYYNTFVGYGRTGITFTTRIGVLSTFIRYGVLPYIGTQQTEIVPREVDPLSPQEIDELITLIGQMLHLM